MSQPPPILSYATPAPAPWSRPAWWVAWIIILGAIGYISFRHPRTPAAASAASGVSAQFDITARYAVGVHALFGDAQLPRSARQSLQASIDALAKSHDDRIRAAIVAGELLGPEEARKRHLWRDVMYEFSLMDEFHVFGDIGPEALTADVRAAFLARYGWYARLALTSNLPDTDPNRQAALAPAIHTTVVLLIFAVVGGGLAIIGLGLFITALVLLGTRKLRPRFTAAQPVALHPTALLEALAVFLSLYVGLDLIVRALASFVPALSGLGIVTIFIAAPVAIVWPLLRGVPFHAWRTALGLHSNPLREIPLGLLGYIAGIPLFVLGVILTYVLIRITGITPTHPATQQAIGASPIEIILLYVLACVWAPITEELLFRGCLFGHLRLRHSFLISATTNAVIFASIHPQGWVAIPALASLAIVFSAIREWRGSIWGSMAAHALNNALVITLLVLALG